MNYVPSLALLVISALCISADARGETHAAELPGPVDGSFHGGPPLCADSTLNIHHDCVFENGISWEGNFGVVEPYYGSFGEAFDLGPGNVTCVSLWHTQDQDSYTGQSTDVYVWDGGVVGEPGAVLALVVGVVFPQMPSWPDFGRFDVEISASVSGDFTVGSWGNWPGARNGYFWLVDFDGPGHPWTHAYWEVGWEGWQHPEVIWGLPIQSMGIGVHFVPTDPVPTAETSWGDLKKLYHPGDPTPLR